MPLLMALLGLILGKYYTFRLEAGAGSKAEPVGCAPSSMIDWSGGAVFEKIGRVNDLSEK